MLVAKKILVRTVTFERVLELSEAPTHMCTECEHSSPMLGILDVCSGYRIPLRAMLDACETGAVHFVETVDLEVLVCRDSYEKFAKE